MSKSWVIIIVLTFIVFIIWLAADLYHTKPSVEITPQLQQALEPLDPNFDSNTIQQIKQIQTPPVPSPKPTQPTPSFIPSPSPTPKASPSPLPSSQITPPASTPSANITHETF